MKRGFAKIDNLALKAKKIALNLLFAKKFHLVPLK
jgi:hypothetical protein